MKKTICLLICVVMAFSLSSCKKFDMGSSKVPSNVEIITNSSQDNKETIKIQSDDEVMPSYVDISLYDEENYADIYLGEKFTYKITYAGSVLSVPSSYEKITNEGWKLIPSENYGEESQILAGKSLKVEFSNSYGKKIKAVFYNEKKSSVSLKKCAIVKFVIEENELINSKSQYGQFWVNGVSNVSAITDIIELLGSPSHFYCITENKYYLDWFITKNDRRSGITVYVDTLEDHIDAIEFSYY